MGDLASLHERLRSLDNFFLAGVAALRYFQCSYIIGWLQEGHPAFDETACILQMS